VMQRAYDLDVTGKGWTWLGGEWVREFTWISASLNADYAAQDAAAAAANSTTTDSAPVGDGGGGGMRRLRSEAAPAAETEAEAEGATKVDYLTQQTQTQTQTQTRGRRASTVSWWGPNARAAGLTIPTTTEKVYTAMQGVVGVVPYRIPPDASLGGFLDRFKTDLIADPVAMTLGVPGAFPPPPIPTEDGCYLLYNAPVTTVGIPLDLFGPYVFNSIYAVAAAVADVMAGDAPNSTAPGVAPRPAVPFASVTSAAVGATLAARGALRPSPLTDTTMAWLGNGDRDAIHMSLVNVQGDRIVAVGAWASGVRAGTWNGSTGSVLAAGVRMGDGTWQNTTTIVWPAGGTLTPPDRALEYDHAEATALVVALFGIIISLLVGAVLHRAGVTVLPESGATVLIGAGFGVILRFMFGSEVRSTAEFSASMFMLVLLPIIIFESGFTIHRQSFYTQLFSINAFAIGGTVISTYIIGNIVWYLGSRGSILSLSWEEAMSFASLLSATDPVATLAVFSSLNVHPTLNALVYGEAVINDAVAIVLYRTFTGFLTSEITTNATLWAVGTFLGILFLSVFVGLIMALLATIAFRYVNVTGVNRTVAWEEEFISKLNAIRKFVPKIAGGGVVADGHGADGEEADASAMGVNLLAGIKETAILLLFAYVAFALSESVSLSGIVAALACGIAMNQYTRPVMTRDGKETSTAVFKMLAHLADTAIFFQIGLNVIINLGVGDYNMGFIIWTLVACIVARACNVFPISYCLNRKRKEEIPFNFQLQMWHAGLRGAIAYATSLSFPSQNRDTVVNATSWICLFTIFAFGGTTTSLLRYLQIPFGVPPTEDETAAAVEEATEHSPTKRAMVWLDKWIKRIIYGRRFLDEMAYANAVAEQRSKIAAAARYGITLPASETAPIPRPRRPEEDAEFHMGHGASRGNKYVTGRRPIAESNATETDLDGDSTDGDTDGGGSVVTAGTAGAAGTGLTATAAATADGKPRSRSSSFRAAAAALAHNVAAGLAGTSGVLSPVAESPMLTTADAVIGGESTAATPAAVARANAAAAAASVRAVHHLDAVDATAAAARAAHHATPAAAAGTPGAATTPASARPAAPLTETSWDAVEAANEREESARGLVRPASVRGLSPAPLMHTLSSPPPATPPSFAGSASRIPPHVAHAAVGADFLGADPRTPASLGFAAGVVSSPAVEQSAVLLPPSPTVASTPGSARRSPISVPHAAIALGSSSPAAADATATPGDAARLHTGDVGGAWDESALLPTGFDSVPAAAPAVAAPAASHAHDAIDAGASAHPHAAHDAHDAPPASAPAPSVPGEEEWQ